VGDAVTGETVGADVGLRDVGAAVSAGVGDTVIAAVGNTVIATVGDADIAAVGDADMAEVGDADIAAVGDADTTVVGLVVGLDVVSPGPEAGHQAPLQFRQFASL
jgi:hypothetical protein